MSNLLAAFLFAIGGGAWIFSRVQNKTGRNTQHSLIVAGVSGGLLFILMLIILAIVGNIIENSF